MYTSNVNSDRNYNRCLYILYNLCKLLSRHSLEYRSNGNIFCR
nr:MAG TPA: hypothetical protein [Caudoviricetes sp.]